MINKSKVLWKYFNIGFLFGLMFPIGAIILQMFISSKFGVAGIISAHTDNPLIYMIDTAPLFLGGFALIGGINQVKSLEYSAELLAAKSEIEDSIKSREEIYKDNKDLLSKTSLISSDLYENLTQIENSMSELYLSEGFIKDKSESVSNSIEEIVNLANRIADKTKLESQSVKNTLVSTELIGSKILSTSNQLKDSMNTFQDDVKNINQLDKEIQSILEIVKIIHNISSDIKLLSLNASIEASRAGEHGKGFAVVADEVRSLSNLSADATSKIEELSNSISLKTTTLKSDINLLQTDLNLKIKEIDIASIEVQKIIHMLDEQKQSSSQVYQLTINQGDNLKDMFHNVNEINNSVANMSDMLVSCKKSINKNEQKVIQLESVKL